MVNQLVNQFAGLLGWMSAVAAITLFFTSEMTGQVVQLPTFSNFSYRGAVSVPDGGTMVVGGVSRSAEGATTRGVPGLSGVPGVNRLFKNRGIGRETSNSQLTIKPQILIMSELEEDHLAAAGYDPNDPDAAAGLNNAILAKAAFLTKHMGRREAEPVSPAGSRR